ncbi:hypothetical protein ACIBHY_49515 [Nonomuraea sp. NPDC050547]|uniref:Flp pilus assembly protein TadB n=1 Tax=Nonomuraea endophytica TaxID=714136 RepID=A0A7W8ADA1_9ACTN|nr:hypothetical protein [Nonomuraea endophytica]MBB5084166.1 Flp pilus assembly protein TadB [Nonomuraea endophytica]
MTPTPTLPIVIAVIAIVLAFLVTSPLLIASLCVLGLICLAWWFILDRRNRRG